MNHTIRGLGLLLVVALTATAQNFTTITATKVQDASGSPLTSGQLCVQGVNAAGKPISYQAGGGGIVHTLPVCATIANGGLAGGLQIANSNYTLPVNVAYSLTIIDNTSGSLISGLGPTQITGSTWSLDSYQPTGLTALVQTGPKGDKGDTGAASVVTSNGATGDFAIAGKLTAQRMLPLALGSSSTPSADMTFTTPYFGLTVNDASDLSSNTAAQGDGSYAPAVSLRVFETGGATVAPLYTEYRAGRGATGGAYGVSSNVSADPGSSPAVVANNPTIQDASHVWLNGCTRSSGVAVCNVYTGSGSVPLFLKNQGSNLACFYITGTSDTSFAANGAVQCPTSWTTTSVTFPNAGSNVSSGVTGGWISPAHQFFGWELNLNNASHDPGHLTEATNVPLPVWGFVSQNTPYTWSNPTGGANIPNLPLSAAFFASGSGDPASAGAQYNGFLSSDAIDDLFVAGRPQIGGRVSTAKAGYRARPLGSAVSGSNYASQKSCWDTSVYNGASSFNDFSYCGQYVPDDNTANVASHFEWSANGYSAIKFFRDARISVSSGSSSAMAYGFSGYTNGIYNAAGITAVNGSFQTSGYLNAGTGFQSNGVSGLSATKNVKGSDGNNCTMTFSGGILTASTCP